MNWMDAIKQYTPINEQEQKDQALILQAIQVFDNLLTRDNELMHITSSAFLVNKARNQTLMVYHNIYNSWSWTGGHADGEADLMAVALKEAQEETGVENIHPVSSQIFSLDILPVMGHIKKGKYVAPHLHLSIAYLIEADETESLTVKADENSGVQWIPIHEIEAYSKEPHMLKVYGKLITKMTAICDL